MNFIVSQNASLLSRAENICCGGKVMFRTLSGAFCCCCFPLNHLQVISSFARNRATVRAWLIPVQRYLLIGSASRRAWQGIVCHMLDVICMFTRNVFAILYFNIWLTFLFLNRGVYSLSLEKQYSMLVWIAIDRNVMSLEDNSIEKTGREDL